MRTLKSVFKGSATERTILFEEEEWCIYKRSKVHGLGKVLILVHRCNTACYSDAMQLPKEPIDSCSACGGSTPDDIKTLYILGAWDQT